MKHFQYTNLAKADLIDIGQYTRRTWGETQAGSYLDLIEDCCQRLAQDPGIGRIWIAARPGLRRMEQDRHVMFYRQLDDGILVCRVLHRNMLPSLHSFEETLLAPVDIER